MRRIAPLVVGLSAGALALAPPALAEPPQTFHADVKLSAAPVDLVCPVIFPQACGSPAAGNSASAAIRFKGRFATVDSVCFVLHFQGDLVDPGERGERVEITYAGTWGFGFANWTDAPIADRTVCVGGPGSETDAFADGRHDITVFMAEGSATLASMEVYLVGSRN